MGIAKKYIEKKATQRIPTPVLDAAGKALIEGVDRAVTSRWDRAIEIAHTTPGRDSAAKAKAISSPIRKSMTALGAAAGATAAAPGIGTSVAMGTLLAELGVVALKTTDMVMSIGAAYGHTDASAEERRAWVLAVMAFGSVLCELRPRVRPRSGFARHDRSHRCHRRTFSRRLSPAPDLPLKRVGKRADHKACGGTRVNLRSRQRERRAGTTSPYR